ncbi:MAG: preprotein translocase subunit SecE [Eubacterium sp.]|nr:preprotein translocase subunit SecE [Eubacterium sp.]MDE6413143.1 preprotein translocase subunit SecE [Eubacterium sp.]
MAKDKKVDETKPVKKADKKKKSKKNPFKSIAAFFKSTNAERKKIVWPTAKETVKNTIIVLVVTLIVGLAIYGVDSLLTVGMKGVKTLANNTTASAEADDTANPDDDLVEDGTNKDTSKKDTSKADSTNTSAPSKTSESKSQPAE